MISKFNFTERYFDDSKESVIRGTIEIHHSLTEEQLLDMLENEGGVLSGIEDMDGVEYVDIEYVNDNYEVTFEPIVTE